MELITNHSFSSLMPHKFLQMTTLWEFEWIYWNVDQSIVTWIFWLFFFHFVLICSYMLCLVALLQQKADDAVLSVRALPCFTWYSNTAHAPLKREREWCHPISAKCWKSVYIALSICHLLTSTYKLKTSTSLMYNEKLFHFFIEKCFEHLNISVF